MLRSMPRRVEASSAETTGWFRRLDQEASSEPGSGRPSRAADLENRTRRYGSPFATSARSGRMKSISVKHAGESASDSSGVDVKSRLKQVSLEENQKYPLS